MSALLSEDPGGSPFKVQIASLTKVDREHPGDNGSTTEPTSVRPSSASSKDFLSASHRIKNDVVKPFTDELAFLKQEFGVKRLNKIHKLLSVVGRPASAASTLPKRRQTRCYRS